MITKIINNVLILFLFLKIIINRVIHKVKKTEHQNPEFEIQKKLEKNTLAFKGGET